MYMCGISPKRAPSLTHTALRPQSTTPVQYQRTRRRNTLCIFDLRSDADYREPSGGFRPVKTTYVWTEDGVEKRHTHTAKEALETYQINCPSRPLMRSLVVKLAD